MTIIWLKVIENDGDIATLEGGQTIIGRYDMPRDEFIRDFKVGKRFQVDTDDDPDKEVQRRHAEHLAKTQGDATRRGA